MRYQQEIVGLYGNGNLLVTTKNNLLFPEVVSMLNLLFLCDLLRGNFLMGAFRLLDLLMCACVATDR